MGVVLGFQKGISSLLADALITFEQIEDKHACDIHSNKIHKPTKSGSRFKSVEFEKLNLAVHEEYYLTILP